jgi:AraC-like DNA-binding protein
LIANATAKETCVNKPDAARKKSDRRGSPISVPGDRITPLLARAQAAGIDTKELLQSLSLPVTLLSPSPGDFMSLADYYRMQNRLSILFGDETLHLSSRQLMSGSTDFVLQHVVDCENLYEVMRVIARTYNLLHGGQFNSVVKRQAMIDYVIDDRAFPYAGHYGAEYIYFQIECILILLHCMLMLVSPASKGAIIGLQIRRPSPGGECGHLGYWDAPIKFGAELYKVSFDREIALQKITLPPSDALTANAVYQKIVDVVAGRHALRQHLQSTLGAVRDALSRGVVEQGDVAAQMGVSVATLRRRLSDEGASFRDLRREVLNETAKRMLVADRPLSEVSEALGFSEVRAFSRAFKDWNGLTPKAFLHSGGSSNSS